jgi:hypothetical protein
MAEETVIHVVHKRLRYMTSVSCISVAGDALYPIMITEYPISDSLWINDLCQDEDAMTRRRTLPYINEALFCEYISTIFYLYLQSIRNSLTTQGEIAMLLMYSCKTHCSEQILKFRRESTVLVLVFPSHITYYFKSWISLSLACSNI